MYIFLLKLENNTGLYSEIQDLTNGLSALNTRVTNAITGGDLAAPFTMNFLNVLYTDYGSEHVYGISGNSTQFSAQFPASGDATLSRRWTNSVKIEKNYKLSISASAVTNGTGSNLKSVQLIYNDGSGEKVMSQGTSSVVLNNMDLSSFLGKTLSFRLQVAGFAGYKTCTISKFVITNK